MADVAQLSIRVSSEEAKTAQANLQGLGNTAGWLEGVVGKLAAAFGAYKLGEYAKDATLLAARYEMLGVVMGVMGNNAGYTRAEMGKFQVELEKTGISMVESRNSLNMLAAAQLDMSKAAELGRVAQDAGRIAQINSSEAFGRLVTGIQTGQAIILHHMGIMVNFEEGYKRLAPTIGKTAQTLTEHEKAQLRLTMALEEGAKRQGVYSAAMETTGGQMLSMPRYIENLQVKLGNIFLPAFTQLIKNSTEAMKGAEEWITKNATSLTALGQALADDVKLFGEFTKMLRDVAGAGNSATESVSFLTYTLQGVGFLFAGATDIVRGFTGALAELANTASYDWDKFNEMFLFGQKAVYKKSEMGSNLLNPESFALPKWHDNVFNPQPAHAVGGTDKVTDPAIARAAEAKAAAVAEAAKTMEKFLKDQAAAVVSLKEEAYALAWGKDALEDHKMAVVGLTNSKEYLLKIQLQLAAADRQIVADEMAAIGSYNGGLKSKQLDSALEMKSAYEQSLDPMKKYSDAVAEINRNLYASPEAKLHAISEAFKTLTPEGIAAAARDLQLNQDASRLNHRDQSNPSTVEGATYELGRLNEMMTRGMVTVDAYKKRWIELQIVAGTAVGQVAEAWETSVNGMSNAFNNFITTGKFNFRDMVSSILADLAKLQANRAFAQLLNYGISAISGYAGGGGSWGGGDGGGENFGNSIGGSTMEGGYVPPPSGGVKGGVSTSIVVNIDQSGKSTTDSKGQGQNAAELGRMIGAKVRETIITEMRPAGLLNPVGAN